MPYARLDWSTLRQTHPRRRAHAQPNSARENHMPERTPVVGDEIRYIDANSGVEVSPLSAFGYISCGIRIEYETYEEA